MRGVADSGADPGKGAESALAGAPVIDVGSPDVPPGAGVATRGPERRAGPRLDTSSTRRGHAAPTPDERRQALRSMLEMADGRRARAEARRRERPVMAPGVSVRIVAGVRRDALATIVDADYIASRVLVCLDGTDERAWVGFTDVAIPSGTHGRTDAAGAVPDRGRSTG